MAGASLAVLTKRYVACCKIRSSSISRYWLLRFCRDWLGCESRDRPVESTANGWRITGNLGIVESYLAAWKRKDLKGIGEHLYPHVHFKSPQGETEGKEALLEGVKRVFRVLPSYEVRSTFASGNQVVAIYH